MCKKGFRHSTLITELDQRLVEHLPNEIEEDKEDEEFTLLASRKIFLIASIPFIVYFPVYYLFYSMSYYEDMTFYDLYEIIDLFLNISFLCLIMKKVYVLFLYFMSYYEKSSSAMM